MGAFKKAQLEPRVVLSTGDTDIMKIYAQCGLGIAIVADHAFDPALDTELAEVAQARALFPITPLYIGVRSESPLSVQALRFIELVSPALGSTLRTPVQFSRLERADALKSQLFNAGMQVEGLRYSSHAHTTGRSTLRSRASRSPCRRRVPGQGH